MSCGTSFLHAGFLEIQSFTKLAHHLSDSRSVSQWVAGLGKKKRFGDWMRLLYDAMRNLTMGCNTYKYIYIYNCYIVCISWRQMVKECTFYLCPRGRTEVGGVLQEKLTGDSFIRDVFHHFHPPKTFIKTHPITRSNTNPAFEEVFTYFSRRTDFLSATLRKYQQITQLSSPGMPWHPSSLISKGPDRRLGVTVDPAISPGDV